jgi:hypothetical protein
MGLHDEDRRVFATIAVWLADATLCVISFGLALGLAVRRFTFARGL